MTERFVCTVLHVGVSVKTVLMTFYYIYFYFSLLRTTIYIFWQIIQGRKQLIVQLRRQIVNVSVLSKLSFNMCLSKCLPDFFLYVLKTLLRVLPFSFTHQEGKDKSFLLDKLQKLQKSDKKPKHKKQKKVCLSILTCKQMDLSPQICQSTSHLFSPILQHANFPSTRQSGSSALVQALLAHGSLQEEEGGYRAGGVPVPSDISTSSALLQAMVSRQRAEEQDADFYQTSPASALVQARQAAQSEEGDGYHGSAGLSEGPVNASGAMAQAMLARRRAEEYGVDDAESMSSSVSAVMMQVMRRAEEPRQNAAPAGSSALIQAMLARQQAQNEYDDGY